VSRPFIVEIESGCHMALCVLSDAPSAGEGSRVKVRQHFNIRQTQIKLGRVNFENQTGPAGHYIGARAITQVIEG
jgi:hypothetical protein